MNKFKKILSSSGSTIKIAVFDYLLPLIAGIFILIFKAVAAVIRFFGFVFSKKTITTQVKNFLIWIVEHTNMFIEIVVALAHFYFENFKNFYPRRASYRLLLIVTTVTYILWIVAFNMLYSRVDWGVESEKKFFIKPGKNLFEISQELKDSGIINNITSFNIAARYLGAEERIISGHYIFTKGMNNIDIVNMITSQEVASRSRYKFKVPEGFRLRQIAKLAEKELGLSPEKFIQEASNDTIIALLGLTGFVKNLEGFLFPETYLVSDEITERELVKMMFNEFNRKIIKNPDINHYFLSNGKKLLELVTLASIVQGEAGVLSEMPRIAGVYLNRIDSDMKLQADPTIQYIIPDERPRRLTTQDLKIESPYNTYINLGLPPGPINNPGLDAIKSVISPEKHHFFFFVAKGDKTHIFSESYEEHKKAINEIRGRK